LKPRAVYAGHRRPASDYFGQVVNLAARHLGRAPGEVLLDTERRALPGRTEPAGDYDLGGSPTPSRSTDSPPEHDDR
jgi:class 3 adenylate cyclase